MHNSLIDLLVDLIFYPIQLLKSVEYKPFTYLGRVLLSKFEFVKWQPMQPLDWGFYCFGVLCLILEVLLVGNIRIFFTNFDGITMSLLSLLFSLMLYWFGLPVMLFLFALTYQIGFWIFDIAAKLFKK
jgi:hypothetical protein